MDSASAVTCIAAVFQEDDETWPEPDRVGRQELEILYNDEHISFTTR